MDFSLHGQVSALLYHEINLDPSHHGMAVYSTNYGYLQNDIYHERFINLWIILDTEYRINILANMLFCRRLSTEWSEEEARERMDRYRMLPVRKEHQFLIPPTDNWSWGKNLLYNKDSLVKMVAGKILSRRDRLNMDNFLKNSALSEVQTPQELNDRRNFNPIEVPVLDLLAVDRDRADSWNVPTSEYITRMQANRGLSLDMLEVV